MASKGGLDIELRGIRSSARHGDVPGLLAGLQSSLWQVRRAALQALARARYEDLAAACLERLSDRSDQVRATAVTYLRTCRLAPRVMSELDGLLADPDRAAWSAAALLGDPGGKERLSSHPDRAALLVDILALRALPGAVRAEARSALAAGGGDSAPLVAGLAARSDVARRACVNLLSCRDGAVGALLARMGDARLAPWCAAALSTTLAGRVALLARPDQSCPALVAAVTDGSLPVRQRIYTTRALVLCPQREAGDALLAALRTASVTLSRACRRALVARDDPRAVPAVVESLHQVRYGLAGEVEIIVWLGDMEDTQALPLLRRLSSGWRALVLPPRVRAAARAAADKILATVAHVPDGAISVAPALNAPTERAISLFHDETPVADEDEAS